MRSSGTLEMTDGAAGNAVTLTPLQLQRLIGLCSELVRLCGEITGNADPAAGRLIEYVAEEIAGLGESRRSGR